MAPKKATVRTSGKHRANAKRQSGKHKTTELGRGDRKDETKRSGGVSLSVISARVNGEQGECGWVRGLAGAVGMVGELGSARPTCIDNGCAMPAPPQRQDPFLTRPIII